MPWNPCGAPGLSGEPQNWDGVPCVDLPWELATGDVIPVQPGDRELVFARTTSAVFWYHNRGHGDCIPVYVWRTVHGVIHGLFNIKDSNPSPNAEAVRVASSPFGGFWDTDAAAASIMEDVNGEACISMEWKRGIPTSVEEQSTYCALIVCGPFSHDNEMYPGSLPLSVSNDRGTVTGWFPVMGPRVTWLEQKPVNWYFTAHNRVDVFLELSVTDVTNLPKSHYLVAATRSAAHVGDPRTVPYKPATNSIVVSPPRDTELRRLSINAEPSIVGRWSVSVRSPHLTWTCLGYHVYPYEPHTVVLRYHALPPSDIGPGYTSMMLLDQAMQQERVDPPEDPAIERLGDPQPQQPLVWGHIQDNGVVGSVLMRVTTIPQTIPCLAVDHQAQLQTTNTRTLLSVLIIATVLFFLLT